MRPYPLIDEIKMHIHTWAADDTWKNLPLGVRDALTTVLNEVRTRELMKSLGLEDEQEGFNAAKERKIFLARYMDRWRDYTSFENTETVSQETRFILQAFCQKLHNEGSSAVEYIDWFFDEFLKIESNKKYYGSPPNLRGILSNNVYVKYLYEKKQSLAARQQDKANLTVKSAVMEIASQYLAQSRNKDFGKRILDYSEGRLSLSRFCQTFIKLLEEHNETEMIEKLKKLMGNDNGQISTGI